MPKNSSETYNQLKINEIPPPILEEAKNVLTSDEALPEPQYGYYIINMMWRLLNALPSDDEFRFYEKDVLEDVLRYGSIDMIAKLNKVSPQTIRAKIKNALARYEDLVRKLEINKDQFHILDNYVRNLSIKHQVSTIPHISPSTEYMHGVPEEVYAKSTQEIKHNKIKKKLNLGNIAPKANAPKKSSPQYSDAYSLQLMKDDLAKKYEGYDHGLSDW